METDEVSKEQMAKRVCEFMEWKPQKGKTPKNNKTEEYVWFSSEERIHLPYDSFNRAKIRRLWTDRNLLAEVLEEIEKSKDFILWDFQRFWVDKEFSSSEPGNYCSWVEVAGEIWTADPEDILWSIYLTLKEES